jgi:sec-independent protein translocase protein TatB
MAQPTELLTANLSIPDTLFLMVLALVVFGPRRLPEIGRQIGKIMYEFRKASNDFKLQMDEELRVAEENDRLKKLEAEKQLALQRIPPVSAANSVPDGEEITVHSPLEENQPGDTTAPSIMIQPPSTGEPVAAVHPSYSRSSLSSSEPMEESTSTRSAAEPSNSEAAQHNG